METLFVLTLLIIFMVSGWSVSLKDSLSTYTLSSWLLICMYSVSFLFMMKAVSFPFTYYSSYFLEHKYELSNETFISWIVDELKGLILGLLFSLIIIEIIYGFMHYFPSYWWLVTAGVICLILILLTKIAPILLLPLFFKLRPIADQDLIARINNLINKTGAKINGIFEMNLSKKSKTANAALAGIGKTRRIILSDTLLDNYSSDEIEVIMAHEMGHHVFNHLWKGIIIQSVLILFLLLIISYTLHWGVSIFHLTGISDIAGLPYLLCISIVFSIVFLPFVNFYLRLLEYQADQYAVAITGKNAAFIHALKKLSEQNLSEKQPNPVVEFIFYSHPSVSKRIEKIKVYGED